MKISIQAALLLGLILLLQEAESVQLNHTPDVVTHITPANFTPSLTLTSHLEFSNPKEPIMHFRLDLINFNISGWNAYSGRLGAGFNWVSEVDSEKSDGVLCNAVISLDSRKDQLNCLDSFLANPQNHLASQVDRTINVDFIRELSSTSYNQDLSFANFTGYFTRPLVTNDTLNDLNLTQGEKHRLSAIFGYWTGTWMRDFQIIEFDFEVPSIPSESELLSPFLL
ncbi:hypothetical protein FGO68_gene17238 [Halteria grandinella]|uniref:Uncharacterized protein n=1 Tax=Halteria grandinella TaxID=5974 RepID=A0A8J8NII3_HALGN|nr:hypothetical protein FGO68_gene17238 [Halteria grandinella]